MWDLHWRDAWRKVLDEKRDADGNRNFRALLVRAHCAAGKPAHKCCGRITLTRDATLFQCALCGDLKETVEAEAKEAKE